MILTVKLKGLALTSIPRESGDDPDNQGSDEIRLMYSPRERG